MAPNHDKLADHDAPELRPHKTLVACPMGSDVGRKLFAAFLLRVRNEGFDALATELAAPGPKQQAALAIFEFSPYLKSLLERHPETLSKVFETSGQSVLEGLRAELEQTMGQAISTAQAMTALRLYKQKLALVIGFYDLAGLWPVNTVTQELTLCANLAVFVAVRFLFAQAQQAGKVVPQQKTGCAADAASGFFVLAMGKQGANELNYSSDVDLIVLFDAKKAKPCLAIGVEMQPFFVKLTQNLVRLLQTRSKDGYVFRTDLRLRPDPGSTQVAISTDAAFAYYESVGQNWERAAMIKARTIAGDIQAGEAFLAELSPFVWRKYLDFSAIKEVHAMKRHMHAVKGHAQIKVAGHNVKLGRGGIREIEFFVQTQQLIAGGRQPHLRGRRTLDTLVTLSVLGWITPEAAQEMGQAYLFLRHVEHRLQMINDEQTHSLPDTSAGGDKMERIARLSGFATVEAFSSALRKHMHQVERHYTSLFEELPHERTIAGNLPNSSSVIGALNFDANEIVPETLETLRQFGFSNPSSVSRIVQGWYAGSTRAMRSAAARDHLTELLPALFDILGQTAHPDQAITSFDQFLKDLPAGVQLFALLHANPDLLHLVADILGQAPRLAQILARRSKLLDAVLDPGFFGPAPDEKTLIESLNAALDPARDFEDLLNLARVAGREHSFLVGVRLLSRQLGAEEAGAAFSTIAQTLICQMKQAVEADFAKDHGHIRGGAMAVLAMGKLGGEEMSATSDIDLIVIYDHPTTSERSDGAKPLPADNYYRRLTQRLITSLSAPTAEGRLYEVDMRLRPSGNAGPVATKIESFVPYQKTEAWTWEHLALTRARVLCGPDKLCKQIKDAIKDVLVRPRDREKIVEDVIKMRALIFTEKGSRNIWDIKQVRGGLVDLEFLVQFMQLIHAGTFPNILQQNTSLSIAQLGQAGLFSHDETTKLVQASQLFEQMIQIIRLCLDGPLDGETAPRGLRDLLAKTANLPDFNHAQAALKQVQQSTLEAFEKYVQVAD